MSSGLALALLITVSSLAALLSAAIAAYSLVRSRFVTEGLEEEVNKLRKWLNESAVYLNGLPATNARKKNLILYSALKLYSEEKYAKAIPALRDASLLATEDDERCAFLNLVGLSQIKGGNLLDAEKTFLEMIVLAENKELDEALAAALGNMGYIYFVQSDLSQALDFLQKALKIDEETKNLRGQARDLGYIGKAYFALAEQKKVFNNYKKAFEHYEKALKIHEETDYREGQARELGNIGGFYLAIGDSRKALDYYEKALDVAAEIDNLELQFNHLNGLAIINKTLKNDSKALACYEKSLRIAERMPDPGIKAGTLAKMGALCIEMRNYKYALDCFQKARDIYAKTGPADKVDACNSSITLARQSLNGHL